MRICRFPRVVIRSLGGKYFAGPVVLVTSCIKQDNRGGTLTGFILEGGRYALAGRAAQKSRQQQPPGQLGRSLRHRLKQREARSELN